MLRERFEGYGHDLKVIISSLFFFTLIVKRTNGSSQVKSTMLKFSF